MASMQRHRIEHVLLVTESVLHQKGLVATGRCLDALPLCRQIFWRSFGRLRLHSDRSESLGAQVLIVDCFLVAKPFRTIPMLDILT